MRIVTPREGRMRVRCLLRRSGPADVDADAEAPTCAASTSAALRLPFFSLAAVPALKTDAMVLRGAVWRWK
jgi:hypothetical protein